MWPDGPKNNQLRPSRINYGRCNSFKLGVVLRFNIKYSVMKIYETYQQRDVVAISNIFLQ